jgi:uncharacterized protein (DUF305 family)
MLSIERAWQVTAALTKQRRRTWRTQCHGAHGTGRGRTVPDDPPMMMGMMAGLSRLSGSAYDIAWLEAMIDHHDDALHMAERILKRAEHKELRTLAESILRDQSAEIAMMEAMIEALSD